MFAAAAVKDDVVAGGEGGVAASQVDGVVAGDDAADGQRGGVAQGEAFAEEFHLEALDADVPGVADGAFQRGDVVGDDGRGGTGKAVERQVFDDFGQGVDVEEVDVELEVTQALPGQYTGQGEADAFAFEVGLRQDGVGKQGAVAEPRRPVG